MPKKEVKREDYPWVFPDGKTEEEQIAKMSAPIREWTHIKPVVVIPLERTQAFAEQTIPRFVALGSLGAEFMWFPYGRIDLVRNLAGIQLLRSDFTHLIMLDADHEHPVGNNDIIRRLARWTIVKPDVQVVGALNFKRGKPFNPVCYVETKDEGIFSALSDWTPGLLKVALSGAGAIMINREVFEQLPMPWFYNIYDKAYLGEYPGEDIGFSINCMKNGIDMYVDTTTTCPHLTASTINEETFRKFLANNKIRWDDVYRDYKDLLDGETDAPTRPA
jgi:hypothetical protein